MTGRVDAGLWRRFTSAVSHGGARFLMVAPRARSAILGERIRATYGMEATISCSSGPASLASGGCLLDDNKHNYSFVVYKADQRIVGKCANGNKHPKRSFPNIKKQGRFRIHRRAP